MVSGAAPAGVKEMLVEALVGPIVPAGRTAGAFGPPGLAAAVLGTNEVYLPLGPNDTIPLAIQAPAAGAGNGNNAAPVVGSLTVVYTFQLFATSNFMFTGAAFGVVPV